MKKIILGLVFALTLSFGTTFDEGIDAINKKDFKSALKIFEKLAFKNDAKAQYALGIMYSNENNAVRQDYSKAKEWYEKAAMQGNPGAQYNIAVMYYRGYGVNKDYTKSKYWLEKAAFQEYPMAQNNLGFMYENGQVVKQDKKVAKELYRKACNNGLQEGCDAYKILNQQGY